MNIWLEKSDTMILLTHRAMGIVNKLNHETFLFKLKVHEEDNPLETATNNIGQKYNGPEYRYQ